MVSIWDIEGLGRFEEAIENAWNAAKQAEIEESRGEESDIERFNLSRLTVFGPWANDNGGTDEIITMRAFIDVEGMATPSQKPNFDGVASQITGVAQSILLSGDDRLYEQLNIDIPNDIFTESAGIELTAEPADNFPEQTTLDLQVPRVAQEALVFDLTRKEAIQRVEGVDFRNLPRLTLAQLRGEQPMPDEEPEEEEPEEEEPEEEAEPEPVVPEPDFPDLPEPVRQFAVSDDEIEVTYGQKDTKRVKVRDIYNFEIQQAHGIPNPPDQPYSFSFNEAEERANFHGVDDSRPLPGIGDLARRNPPFFVARTQQSVPPSTFPRTGVYLRNYLTFRGPVYPLKFFNELLVYLAYVNGIWNYELRVGTYNSVRRYFFKLLQIEEEGGPQLIERMSQQAAASYRLFDGGVGLRTVPDHPSIEGETAPWLERRQWYKIVPGNADDDAWLDPVGFLEELRGE